MANIREITMTVKCCIMFAFVCNFEWLRNDLVPPEELQQMFQIDFAVVDAHATFLDIEQIDLLTNE